MSAGAYTAAMLGILAISAGTCLCASEKEKIREHEPNAPAVKADFNYGSGRKYLSFEYKESLGDLSKFTADELVRKAVDAYKEGIYEKASDLYGEAIKKFEAVADQNPAVRSKIESCKLARSKCYYYWAEKLYFEALDSADLKQFDEAIQKCTQAAAVWPGSKKKMDETIERFKKMRASAVYVENTKEEALLPDLEEQIFSADILLRQGDAYYADGQWSNARDKYEDVLRKDPYNVTAIDSIRKVNKKLIEAGKRRRNVSRQQYIAETNWSSVIPLVPREIATEAVGKIEEEEVNPIVKDQRAKSITEKLDTIIIPGLSFPDGEYISDVLKVVQQRSFENNNGDGVNIVYIPYTGQQPTTTQTANTFGDVDAGFGGAPQQQQTTENADEGEEEKRITIDVKAIALRDVIQTICATANLKYKIEDHAVVIAPQNVPLDEKETRIFPIEKTTYDDMTQGGSLKDYFMNELQIKFDDGSGVKYISGRLVVTNTPGNIQLIKDHIDQITVSDPQVLVETKFMEISMNDLEELGFHYLISRRNSNIKYMEQSKLKPANAGTPNPDSTVNVYYPQKPGEKYSQYYATWSPGDDPLKLPDGEKTLYYTKAPIQNGGSQLTFGQNSYELTRTINDIGSRNVMNGLFSAQYTNSKTGFSVSGAVTAIDQADSSDVMFCPRITTTNNYPANIKMVTKKYFPTDWEEAEVGTIAGPSGDDVPLFTASIPELEESELGVILPVRPTIQENQRTISVPINPVVKEHVGWVDYSYPLTVSVKENESATFTNIVRMPIFEERNVLTTVNCDDGETIILGGVVHDTTNAIDDQYPLLGNLPLIGRLFQSKAKVSEKKNLLIFMTCRLITPDGSPVREREMRGLPPFRQ